MPANIEMRLVINDREHAIGLQDLYGHKGQLAPLAAVGDLDDLAHDNRVILKLDSGEVEIGSIGIRLGAARSWGIDTVIPMRTFETQGEGKDRRDCMRQFRAARDRFAADEANLTEFLNAKRKRR